MMMRFAKCFAAAAAVACVAGAIADPVRIDVTSKPEGARVFVDGSCKGATPISIFDAAPGMHVLKVEAAGMRSAVDALSVKDGDFLRRDYELEPEKGLLFIDTEPRGAEVLLDGAAVGTTPFLSTTLDTGRKYAFDLACVGYQTKRIEVSLEGRSPVARVEKLVLDSGTVECTSEPAGATVLVNGINRGTTPCTVQRVPKGVATFVLRLKGYEDAKRELRIAPGDSQSLSLALQAKPATLKIVSYPDGARVFLDDNFQGKTPLVLNSVKPGVYKLRSELAGYGTLFRAVTVENGSDMTEEFKFESILGWIEVTTTPPGAKILIDGKVVGATSSHLGKNADLSNVKSDVFYIRDVEAGEHQLVAHLNGYADSKRKITVAAKKKSQFNPRLKRIFTPDTEIETVNGKYSGVLMDSGNPETYRLEIKDGVTRDFRKSEVRSIKALE